MTYEHWREQLGSALDPRFFTLAYLDELIATNAASIIATDKAAIVIEPRFFPTGAVVVNGLVAAGELEEIKKLIGRAEELGRKAGCIGAIIESREGWARALKSDGYETFQISLFKEL